MIVKNCTLIKPLSCQKQATVVDVARILRDNKQRRLIVVDENESPIGIISTTDINNKVAAENKQPSEVEAEEIMASPIYLTCTTECELKEVYAKMTKHQSYFVPVTKDGKLFGILTYGELFKRVKEKMLNE